MHSDTPSGNLEERLRAALAGRFEIQRELLGGGMSRVFVAREVSLDRSIVLKVLPPELAAEVNRDRFRQEVQFAARLQHPHIVPLLSAGEEGGLLYYTMPFIEGESLKADLAGGRKFSEDEAVEILIDIADALAYAHEAGIVHRDIKPANILRSGAHAVVTDFGVAKALTAALRTRVGAGITTSGVAIGTPAYMAPEQIAGDPAADHRVDIYAMGLLAYELLTGHAPFSGPSPQAMLAAHLTGRAEPLGKLRGDLSPTLIALVERMLEKEAKRRPSSATSVLEILRTIAMTSGVRRVSPSSPRARWGTALIGAVVVAMGVVAWLSIRSARAKSAEAESSISAAKDSIRHADSLLRAGRQASVNDSAGRALAQRDEQKRLQRIADSFSTLQKNAFDSAMKQLAKSGPPVQTPPAISSSAGGTGTRIVDNGIGTPEAFQQRALSMGPPRRVFVELGSSMLRTPDVVLRAGVLRDSIIHRLGASGRYRPIAIDSAQAALTRTRVFDSLGKWLNVDLFVTIRTSTGRADSVQWQLDVRDLTAMTIYSARAVNVTGAPVADGLEFNISKLIDQAVRQLADADRSPRKAPAK